MDPLPATPDDAIALALAGNRRFVDGQSTVYHKDLDLLHARTAEDQHPFVAILACADSRVPVGLVLDEHIGRVFVTRIAGNTASTEVIASLEYAVAILGVKAIIVMGHTNCGAIKAAIRNDAVPGQISALFAGILPAISMSGGAHADPDAVTRQHVLNQVGVLTHASTVIDSRVEDGSLKVVPALYDVATGVVSLLSERKAKGG
jgi:carbonic anhydrase